MGQLFHIEKTIRKYNKITTIESVNI